MENHRMNYGNTPTRSSQYRQHPALRESVRTVEAEWLPREECKSLAMAYVQWQQWQEVYCCDKALENGTLFPELNKPFLGRCMS